MAFKIGALAKATGVKIDTLRYYERIGLLSPEGRTEAGYREYAHDAIQRLRFIRKAQGLGFSLSEIGKLLVFGSSPESTAGDILEITEQKIAEQQAKIEDLTQLRASLVQLALDCTGEGPVEECPILNHFYDEGDAVLPSAKSTGMIPPAASTRDIPVNRPLRTSKEDDTMIHDFDACRRAPKSVGYPGYLVAVWGNLA
ncbi:heavy metal-responsive transcriptional regulator [Pelagivirga sediminicola]|nr:heavy metal-responsive transcriptional regulator [Pelagivirga sediminicola]